MRLNMSSHSSSDFTLQECLRKMLLFDKLEADVQRKIVMEMYERSIKAGDILIQEGDVGIAASELYVVKEGEFEVRSYRVIVFVRARCSVRKRAHCLPPLGSSAAVRLTV